MNRRSFLKSAVAAFFMASAVALDRVLGEPEPEGHFVYDEPVSFQLIDGNGHVIATGDTLEEMYANRTSDPSTGAWVLGVNWTAPDGTKMTRWSGAAK